MTQQLSFFYCLLMWLRLSAWPFSLKMMNMRYFSCFLFLAMMFVACSNDGDSTIPEIPDDPDGSKVSMLSRGGASLFLDDTGNGIALDGDGCLQGENVFFSTPQKCDGLSYVTAVPAFTEWKERSRVLAKGEGLVMGSKMPDGVTFTRIFVDAVDTLTGDVKIKSQSPFYGSTDNFYLNHRQLVLFKEAGDTNVVLIKPTSYNVELASGEWASLRTHIAYVALSFSANRTGAVRSDTLIFSNGVFRDKILPIFQLDISGGDSIAFDLDTF